MSLLVWLPLTQDLRNNGLNNTIITNNGATIDNNGKLGKCLKTASQSIDLKYTPDLNNKSLSIGGWFKFNKAEIQAVITSKANITQTSTACTGNLIGNNSYGGFGLIYGTNNLYTSNKELSSISIYPYIRTSTEAKTTNSFSITFDTWYHIFAIWDNENRKLKLYKDGVLYSSNSVGAFSDAVSRNLYFNSSYVGGGNGPGLSIPFYSNDVRVYDHALSDKEIKELSKGLVLHYPLSNSGDGADNILPGTVQNETTYAYPTSSYKDKWTKKTAIIPSASTYTLSFYAKSTVNGDKIRAHYYNPNTTVRGESSQGTVSTSSEGNITFTLSTDWQKYWVTYAQNATTATKKVIFPRMGSTASYPDMSGTGTVSIKNVKFEEGNKSTVWKPNSTDPAYTSLNYNSTTEYDTSGNGYNGTKSGTLTNSSNTSRNSICTTFASGSHIAATINPTGYANSYTFSWWGKYTNYSGHMMWGFANGNRLNLYMSSGNFYWNTGDGNNNPFNVSAATYGDGNWHHFAISGDGTTTKLYIDGEFKANAKTYKGVTGTSLYFNGWDSSTSYNFGGSLSDFRLYSTVLSADDIKELYQSAAHIDKNGNLFGYEFVEI